MLIGNWEDEDNSYPIGFRFSGCTQIPGCMWMTLISVHDQLLKVEDVHVFLKKKIHNSILCSCSHGMLFLEWSNQRSIWGYLRSDFLGSAMRWKSPTLMHFCIIDSLFEKGFKMSKMKDPAVGVSGEFCKRSVLIFHFRSREPKFCQEEFFCHHKSGE